MKVKLILIAVILFSCSHHMIRDYIMVTDDNKREYFRVFQEDTSKIVEYCHNNFLPEREQEPIFGDKIWIDVVEDVDSQKVELIFKKAVYYFETIIEINVGTDTFRLISAKKPENKIRKTVRGPKRAYRYYSYSGDDLNDILEKISLHPELISGYRSLGGKADDTLRIRPISGVPIVKEQYKSSFFEFDDYEKLGIKNTLELYRDLKRKYKQ